jgi:Spy/CpxP family protein refolding chaperone
MIRILAGTAFVVASSAVLAQAPSPYAGQEAREIKSLSQPEVADYVAGRGMGLAKAAELNGYPGPAHVMELALPLALTAEQRAATEAVFAKMHERAVPLGERLVAEERALDALFASHAVTPESLHESLTRIARLQGEIREVHLSAHLQQLALLTPDQARRYAELRGYAGETGTPQHEHGQSHGVH